MNHRTAVVLCNLGGPTSLEAVEDFLANLFADPDIFRLPLGRPLQRLVARLIARRRAPEARKGYAAIGGRSPLLENTERQAQALAQALAAHGDYDVFVCMRYWHPLTSEVVRDLKARGYARVTLLPLYPQYSITTSGSAYNEFVRQCARQGYAPALSVAGAWYGLPDYQTAIVQGVRDAAAGFADPAPARIELLFSAHGLPRKIVDRGDPYERHVRETYDSVVKALGWPNVTLCYQSRVGPLEWLGPYTDAVIRAKAASGCAQMLVYPIAFVSDHIETLYELGILYARLARELGVRDYRVVPALNAHPLLIRALVRAALEARPA